MEMKDQAMLQRFFRAELIITSLLLILMLAFAFDLGVSTTGALFWPADSDLARDSSQAMTVYDGDLLGDPQYPGELLWYNPLTPSLVALLAKVTGQPLPLIYTRAGAYLNLLAPILFYALVAVLLDRWTALAATFAFLFVQIAPPTASALYATYSPVLYAANLAQAGLYGTLIVFVVAVRTQRRRWYALTGVLLGLTFLAHTAPAIVLGLIVALQTLVAVLRHEGRRRTALINFGLIIGLALIFSAPLTCSLVGHYRLRVLNLTPGDSIHPPVALDNLGALLRTSTIEQPLFIVVIIGLLAILARSKRPYGRRVVCLWLVGAIGFMSFSYARQYLKRQGVELPGFVPSHHFLFYLRAAESILLGAGVIAICGSIGAALSWLFRNRSTWRLAARPAVERGLVLTALALLLVGAYPRYLEREDFNDFPQESVLFGQDADRVNAYTWLRANTQPSDVFLTSDRLATYVVGPAGRKIVAGDSFFANPYVDWKARATDRDAMFGQLMAGDAAAFSSLAQKYHLTYVFAGGRLAKGVEAGALPGVNKVFSGESLIIFRVERP
jgi:hypothetical protein